MTPHSRQPADRDAFLTQYGCSTRSVTQNSSVHASLSPSISQHGRDEILQELERHADLFDTLERSPLTLEQRIAAVTMANRNLLIAAAGSGKTSSMVGKVAYAIQSGLCTPEQILVLAFNRKAALELDTRLRACLARFVPADKHVIARTLHALGLDVVTQVKGYRPQVQQAGADMLHTVLKDLVQHDADFAEGWLLFRVFYHVAICHPDQFARRRHWQSFIRQYGQRRKRSYGFVTLQDELLPTQFEQAVANFLYLYGIDYTYTSTRSWLTAAASMLRGPAFWSGCGFARPLTGRAGFRLNKTGCYLVCLARADGSARLSPHTISVTLAQFHAGTAFASLRKTLGLDANLLKTGRMAHVLGQLGYRLTPGQTEFLARFIRIARLGGLDADVLMKRSLNGSESLRTRLHAPMLARLLSAYRLALDKADTIDFEGMLHSAADYLDTNRCRHGYTLILIDEFQDTSQGGLRLLKSMLAQNRECKLFAVGDDWQSIYRFAGALPDVLTRFEHHFGPAAINHLTATFRFDQSIADLATRFIQANPAQLRKRVVARPAGDGASAFLIRYSGTAHMYALCEICLGRLAAAPADPAAGFMAQDASGIPLQDGIKKHVPGVIKKRSVYILGRYRHQRPRDLERWQQSFPQLDIQYQTVHSAKGLEADIVIVLGLHAGQHGFPSQVPDDPLMALAMPAAEPFPHAEERRLFYVAITRCRHRLYLLVDQHRPSPFVTELLADPANTLCCSGFD